MKVLELVAVALNSIRNNKLRSFLTTLGIVIGIASVIAVVAIGQAGRTMLMQEMDKFGANIFMFWVNENYREGDFALNDVNFIKQVVPTVKYLSPLSYQSANAQGTRGTQKVTVLGTNSDYAGAKNLVLLKGRFISPDDEAAGRRVVVIEEDTASKLFGYSEALGKRIILSGSSVTVIGVLKKDVSMFNSGSRQVVYVPITSLSSLTGYAPIVELVGSASSKENIESTLQSCKTILERRHNAPDHYTAYNMEEEIQSVNKITRILGLILSCVAGISLLVGGIGVMNIMLVSVSERTREIGIRMALGAQRWDILVQFLIESVVLCLLGGLLGTIIGEGGALLVSHLAKWPPLVSWSTILLAFLFSSGVGLFFGIYPANQASKMDPIEALRYE